MTNDLAPFFLPKGVAIIGASTNPRKLSHGILKNLTTYGFKGGVYPVNPGADTIDGVKCFRSVSELPREVKGVIFMTPKEATLPVAREVIAHGIKDLWIQQGAETKEVISELEKEDVNLIHNQCMLMFWKPNGIHSFHRFLKKIFGGLPA